MTDLRLLLGSPDSFLGAAGEVALAGFESALRRALELAPANDPNRSGYETVLAGIRASRAGAPSAPAAPSWDAELALEPLDAPPRAPTARPPAPGGPTGLTKLFQEFATDPAVVHEFGTVEAHGATTDEALWARLNVLLLRASKHLADQWLERLRPAAGTGPTVVLPGERDEELFPPLAGAAGPTGLRLSPSAPPDPRLGAVGTGPAARFAGPVTIGLWLLDNDPDLHHAIEAVSRYGRIPLKGTVKVQVQRELVQRFRAFCDAVDVEAEARAWHALDEALNGLLHNPVAHDTSWWRRTQKRFRDTVLELRDRVLAAGRAISVLVPEGRYADVKQYTDRTDKPAEDPVPPGDVVVCLRIFMKLDGAARPGRVLYRPR